MANVFRQREISLFDEFYPIIGEVQPENAAQFAEKRTFGDFSKDSELIRSSWVISDQRGGIGVKDMEEERDHDRVWWSTAWINTKGHLTNGILASDATNPTGGQAAILIEYNNQMYAAFGKVLYRRVEGGNSWTSIGTLVSTPTDAIVHKNKLYLACASDFNRYDGTTLTTGSSLGSVQPSRYFVEWDSKLYNLDNDGQMDFTIDEGVSWVTDALSVLPSGHFTSLFLYHDGSSPPKVIIYLGTKEGLYEHDNDQTSFKETELRLPFHEFNCKGATWWRQWAFLSSGMSVYELQTASGGATVRPVGMDRDQGVPQAYAGHIVKFLAGHNFLYALVDATEVAERTIYGAAQGGGEFSGGSTWDGCQPDSEGFSYVARWDGYGWSIVHVSESADTPMVSGALATAEDEYRLWYSMNNTVYYVPLPVTLDNPVLVSTSKFNAQSENITPWFDADNEVETKLGAEVTGLYENMTDDEYITLDYALDGDDDTWTNMTNDDFPDGQIDKNGEFIFEFSSGAGVAFTNIRFRERLYRRTTGDSPELYAPDRRWLRLSYVPLLTPKYGFKATVDCSRSYRFRNTRQMVTALRAAERTQTMGTFSFRDQGSSESHRVRIANMAGAEIGGRRAKAVFDVTLIAP